MEFHHVCSDQVWKARQPLCGQLTLAGCQVPIQLLLLLLLSQMEK